METFSTRLYAIMKQEKITQKELSARAGVAQGTISKYLNGQEPKSAELSRIAQALGVTMDQLYSGENTEGGDISVHGNSGPVAIQSPRAMLLEERGEESTAEALARLEARVDGLSDQLSTIQGLLLKLLNQGGK